MNYLGTMPYIESHEVCQSGEHPVFECIQWLGGNFPASGEENTSVDNVKLCFSG